jgi:hypothetical protein
LIFLNFQPKIKIDISKGDGVHPITAGEADNSCNGEYSLTGGKKQNSCRGRPEGVFLWT